jgi:hypothetical protein
VEGKVVRGEQDLDLGDRCRAKLVEVSVPNGWIDLLWRDETGREGRF